MLMRGLSLTFALALMVLVPIGCSGMEGKDDSLPLIEFQPGKLVSASACGQCHTDIYSVWKSSVHAGAATNSVFERVSQDFARQQGDSSREVCLKCHAPATLLNGDMELTEQVSREGVSCDFCHSLKGTDLNGKDHPFVLDVSEVKFGPVKGAESSGHLVEYSEFFQQSEHCAGCHEYSTESGIQLLSTYSEWQDYMEKGGRKSCQSCHMPLVMATVVDPKVRRVEGSFVNLHSMPGGHSKAQLVKSIRLRIMSMERVNEGIAVRVKLENLGAGHFVPTGTPTRKLVLNVEARTPGGEVVNQERVYQKIVTDASGNPILEDSLLFSNAASIISDNRIAPGEERIEELLLPAPKEENVEVTASLTYLYSPLNETESETRVNFYSESRKLQHSWRR